MKDFPTTQETKETIISKIEEVTGQSVPASPKSFVRVFSTAVAGMITAITKQIQQAVKESFPQTATSQGNLSKFADISGLTQRAAVQAEVQVSLTATSPQSVPVGSGPLGPQFRYFGVSYYNKEDITVPGGSVVPATLVASEGGEAGNRTEGDVIVLTTFIEGLSTDCPVTESGTISLGRDVESDESFSLRVAQSWRRPPIGLTPIDFANKALALDGVSGAFAYSGTSRPTTVDIYIEVDDDKSGSNAGMQRADGDPMDGAPGQTGLYDNAAGDGYKSAQLIAASEAIISPDFAQIPGLDENDESSPDSANHLKSPVYDRNFVAVSDNSRDLRIFVTGSVAHPVHVMISGVADENGNRAAAQTALDGLMQSLEPFVRGYNSSSPHSLTQNDVVSNITDALSTNSGLQWSGTATFMVDGEPQTNYALPRGHRVRLAGVTFS